jgi:endonuclease/exonuclease/phosphatase family metal-dependent hydrolase
MTYNIKYYKTGHESSELNAIKLEITKAKPDLLLLQDANNAVNGPIGALLRGWNVRALGQYAIASRLPLSDAQLGSISFLGRNHPYLRCQLMVGPQVIRVYSVHLLTPRSGLAAIKHREGISEFELETKVRLVQAQELTDDLKRESSPVILAGDFNAPLQSLVCRTVMHGRLQDAFAAAGRGYGYTYGHSLRLGQSFVRIDHIFVDPRLAVADCWTGDASGSDHRPVIADITIPQ